MSLTILLPILVFIAVVFLLLGSLEPHSDSLRPWQDQFLVAITLWAAFLVFLTEGLSLVHGLSRWPIAAGWLLALIVVLAAGVRSGSLRRGYQAAVSGLRSLNRLETGLLVAIAGLSFLLFAVAVVTPTNNVDAMNYHMPRVMQWAQNRTLAHFPTVHESQNIRPYWAEAVILNFRLLWGNDQPAGLAQWMIMVSSLIATSGIARMLGGDRKAQWLTTVLAFSIPMGLLQSTTTQNDYVSAFWVVCLASFVILSRQRQLSRLELLGLGLSLGLGMLTKGTFFPFAGPLMLWFILGLVIDEGFMSSMLKGLALFLIVLAINGFFFGRNIQSTGGPYGPSNPLRNLENLIPRKLFAPHEIQSPGNSALSPQTWKTMSIDAADIQTSGFPLSSPAGEDQDPEKHSHLVQMARLIGMNFVSPFSSFNKAYFRTLRLFPNVFSEQYVSKLENAAWNHEDTAGSPVHMVLVLISVIIGAYKGIRGQLKDGLAFSLVLTTSFTLVTLIGSGLDIYVIRYQLGFFLLGAPLVGVILPRMNRFWLVTTSGLLLYSIPYILFSNMRPVIGHKPWPTRVASVFTANSEELLFAINPGVMDDYLDLVQKVEAANCKRVGLSIERTNLEYQFWYLLGAPNNGIIIRHIKSPPEFSRNLDPQFQPCAVICTDCQALDNADLLPVRFDYGYIQLYLDEGFSD